MILRISLAILATDPHHCRASLLAADDAVWSTFIAASVIRLSGQRRQGTVCPEPVILTSVCAEVSSRDPHTSMAALHAEVRHEKGRKDSLPVYRMLERMYKGR